jgi:hypothetical protein
MVIARADVPGERIASIIMVTRIGGLRVLRLLVTANVVPDWRNLVYLMTQATRSSETTVLIRVTRR